MRKKRFSEEQIVKILSEAESGTPVTELCRRYNVSSPTFYEWKKKYGGMTAEDVRELKSLRSENQRLKKLLADKELAIDALKDVNSKKW